MVKRKIRSKRTVILFYAVILWYAVCICDGNAQDRLTLDLDMQVLSKFIWRGEPWTDDPVFWPQVTARWKGLRSYMFFNIDLTDINDDLFECNEIDYLIDYTFTVGSFGIAPGILHFSSPTDFFEPSTKIILGLKAESFMNSSLRVFYRGLLLLPHGCQPDRQSIMELTKALF